MPKVKTSKSRIHHKAAGNKESVATATTTAATTKSQTSTTESLQQLGLELAADKKEDKRKQKHDKWISKLEATYNPQKKKKKKSAKNQTLAVDFESLHDALTTLDSDEPSSGPKSKGSKGASKAGAGAGAAAPTTSSVNQFTIHADSSKPLQSKKAKKKAAMQEILRFQNVLAHPSFKNNPLLTIQQHVKNTMQMAPADPSTTTASVPELMED
ncbi:ribosome biogenesis protein SLX9-domain-containing protein [Mortierella sp. GBAus27b]|nr:ribosome biogenesis protein SLX9-domain-containing protein [Mortierella sp. GBAus27b]